MFDLTFRLDLIDEGIQFIKNWQNGIVTNIKLWKMRLPRARERPNEVSPSWITIYVQFTSYKGPNKICL